MENTTRAPSPSDEPRQRYIRTFEGDVKTLEEGGTPDLAPFEGPSPVEEAPPAAAPKEPAEMLPALTPAEQEQEARFVAQEKSAQPEPVLEVEAEEPLPKAPEALVPPERPTLSIETYADDFKKRMQDTQASTATVLAAEQDAAPTLPSAPREQGPRERMNPWPIVAAILLLALGGTGVYFAYERYLTAATPIAVAPGLSAPIFFDDSTRVAGSGETLLREVEQAAVAPVAPGTVTLLAFDPAATTTKSVFVMLPLHAPSLLTRNIETVGSMAGIVNAGGGQSPFFILAASSYSATFSGMLSWEATMPRDMAGLFPAPAAATSTATTTPPAKVPPVGTTPKSDFRDEVVGNHDVRIYRDSAGRSVLLYGYWNEGTLVIARDPAAFVELLGRLATAHPR